MIMSSGPKTGLNELTLPPVEPGSSMMPGKVNPSILECCNMVCFQVLGNRTAVEKASSLGNFDLNVYLPLVAFNLINSIKWLSNGVKTLNEKCVKCISVNVDIVKGYLESSSALATVIAPLIGYEKATKLTKESLDRNVPVAQLILEKEIVTREQLERLIKHSQQPNIELIKRLKDERSASGQ
jgi:aspartate ammonia-lyase